MKRGKTEMAVGLFLLAVLSAPELVKRLKSTIRQQEKG